MTFIPVLESNRARALQLLQEVNLPVEDIHDHVELYALTEADAIIGTVGMEYEGEVALLRSLSIEENRRGEGFGEQLVQFIEKAVKAKGVKTFYRLTTTADRFFARIGYLVIQRSEVPVFIQQTSEFSSLCPSTAILMKKELL